MTGDAAYLTWQDVDALLPRRLFAILPVGAVEQHGPHLPLTTDADIADGVALRIASQSGGILLPRLAYGDAFTARTWPGTVSIRPETLTALVEDIGLDLHRQGFAGLVTVNAHFGNRAPLARAARTLDDAGMPVLMLDHPGLSDVAAALCDSAPAGPEFYHADEVETAMMLALRPDAVRMDLAVAEYPTFPPTFGLEPMQLREISQSGVFGDPRPATPGKGHALLDGIAAAATPLIAAFRARHDLHGTDAVRDTDTETHTTGAAPWPR